ncbi:MAG: hypothetical protein CV045_10630 [Cyanobacteria bacterium M5B4]|nr:MAG: hypothetical protein CV045_10630 [Cyanobacteria bacterium M5B4]
MSWRVDFAILNAQNSPVFFIEAKGYPTDTFRLKLRLFQDIYPDQLLLLCFASEHNAQKCKKMHKYVTSLLWLKNKLLSFPVIKEIAQ